MKWIDHLRAAGLTVDPHDVLDMAVIKQKYRVPKDLESCHTAIVDGYVVEGRIPLKNLAAVLQLPAILPGVKIRCGLYRAEFSHDRSGRPVDQKKTLHNLGRKIEGPPPIEEWISWVDPKVKEPDFHIPASLGWLEFDKAH